METHCGKRVCICDMKESDGWHVGRLIMNGYINMGDYVLSIITHHRNSVHISLLC